MNHQVDENIQLRESCLYLQSKNGDVNSETDSPRWNLLERKEYTNIVGYTEKKTNNSHCLEYFFYTKKNDKEFVT